MTQFGLPQGFVWSVGWPTRHENCDASGRHRIHAKSASVPRLALRPFSYRLARAKRASRETEKAQGRSFFLGFFLVRQAVSACNCMITQGHFKLLAAYNRWANARLYAAALDLSELSYRLHTGVYFGSLHGTLNHLLLTDRLWLKRLTGVKATFQTILMQSCMKTASN